MVGQTNISEVHVSLGSGVAQRLCLTTVKIDPLELAKLLAPYVAHGSKLRSLDKEEIVVRRNPKLVAPQDVTIPWLMEMGNPFFNCLFWVNMSEDERVPLKGWKKGQKPKAITAQQVCEALFYQYFMIVTRSSTSDAEGKVIGRDVPNFLAGVLGLKNAPKYYAELLATFDLGKLDPAWARYIPQPDLSQEARSRLSLGVAGYRMLGPFKLLRPVKGLRPAMVAAYEFAAGMAYQDPMWSIHPATRDAGILSTYGPLNSNLGNLMLEVFSYAELSSLVSSKALYKIPTFDATARNYENWRGKVQVKAGDFVFSTSKEKLTGFPVYGMDPGEGVAKECALTTNPKEVGYIVKKTKSKGSKGDKDKKDKQKEKEPEGKEESASEDEDDDANDGGDEDGDTDDDSPGDGDDKGDSRSKAPEGPSGDETDSGEPEDPPDVDGMWNKTVLSINMMRKAIDLHKWEDELDKAVAITDLDQRYMSGEPREMYDKHFNKDGSKKKSS